jgi:hypothetical protein
MPLPPIGVYQVGQVSLARTSTAPPRSTIAPQFLLYPLSLVGETY